MRRDAWGREMAAARRAALSAGDLLRGEFRRHRTIAYKGGRGNLVTDMDRRAEDAVVRILRRAFPSHGIVGEEGGGRLKDAEYRWHVDPIDGTTNYAHGLAAYTVSIGLERRGTPVAGVVYDPSRDELFHAARGGGAWCGKRRLRVSRTTRLGESLLATGFPYSPAGRLRNLRYFDRLLPVTRAIRRLGSASLDLCYTASGIFDGFWEFGLKSWDVAAGVLIVEEAGGKVTDFSGGPAPLDGEEFLATNGKIHRAMVRVLNRPT